MCLPIPPSKHMSLSTFRAGRTHYNFVTFEVWFSRCQQTNYPLAGVTLGRLSLIDTPKGSWIVYLVFSHSGAIRANHSNHRTIIYLNPYRYGNNFFTSFTLGSIIKLHLVRRTIKFLQDIYLYLYNFY